MNVKVKLFYSKIFFVFFYPAWMIYMPSMLYDRGEGSALCFHHRRWWINCFQLREWGFQTRISSMLIILILIRFFWFTKLQGSTFSTFVQYLVFLIWWCGIWFMFGFEYIELDLVLLSLNIGIRWSGMRKTKWGRRGYKGPKISLKKHVHRMWSISFNRTNTVKYGVRL